ncbi:type II restriction endonuclease [Caproiciproducens sp. R2]|uniref:type II restriction endonuclease n=1 Tax=Caproiciproducens sp. R2 TaxID=3435187 RepID=UPI0040341D43
MDSISNTLKAIETVNNGQISYCKFLSANDTGDTGAHQAGIYITKNAVPILFKNPGRKGENKEKFVKIKWQDDFSTDSRFIYYGKGTRNEYRVTRFNRGFPYLRTEHTGDLFVLVKLSDEDYSGFVLETEDEINEFLNAFSMSPADTGTIIQKAYVKSETRTDLAMMQFIETLTSEFPPSKEMSATARKIYNVVYDHEENIVLNPDRQLISWVEMEYHLFRKIEYVRYGNRISKGFSSVDQFIEIANAVLNRRKSRAGKSLEHHLSAVFDGNSIKYVAQPTTEGNKRPDFIFPNAEAYHNLSYSSDELVFLGAKTTCKDRWRQIISEADRIETKHLFTLQQGISAQQMEEMEEAKVILVVPEPYIGTYPKEKRSSIWTLKKFIEYIKEKTNA